MSPNPAPLYRALKTFYANDGNKIFHGQVFCVDDYFDLPQLPPINSDVESASDYWEEINLNTARGSNE